MFKGTEKMEVGFAQQKHTAYSKVYKIMNQGDRNTDCKILPISQNHTTKHSDSY